MQCIEMQAMTEEYYEEEEFVDEEFVDDEESLGDEDFLASIKSSLMAEARQLQAAKEAKMPAQHEESASAGDTAVEYEEIVENSGSFSEQEVDAAPDPSDPDPAPGEDLDDEDYMESVHSSMQKLFRERKAAVAAAAAAASPKVQVVDSERVEVDAEDDGSEAYEYEEQVIERWFERDPEPEDMEAACRALIPIVYKGENLNAETMMRRTPLPELYKYLKQHYDYKKEVKQDLTEEETKSGEAQTSLENLFKRRSAGHSHGGETAQGGKGGMTSEVLKTESRGAPIRVRIQSSDDQGCEPLPGPNSEDSQVLDADVLVDSTTDLGASCLLMGESERSFEEFVDETEHDEVEVEETIHEDAECDIVEETWREDDDEEEILEETLREDDDDEEEILEVE